MPSGFRHSLLVYCSMNLMLKNYQITVCLFAVVATLLADFLVAHTVISIVIDMIVLYDKANVGTVVSTLNVFAGMFTAFLMFTGGAKTENAVCNAKTWPLELIYRYFHSLTSICMYTEEFPAAILYFQNELIYLSDSVDLFLLTSLLCCLF